MRSLLFTVLCLALSAHGADARRLETERIQREIDRVSAAGGGRVVISKGVHECGTLHLKSGVELHLEEGAVLSGGSRSEDYDDAIPAREVYSYEGCHTNVTTRKAFICAENATNIAITGSGVIDLHGPDFFDRNTVLWERFWAKPPCMRPRMVVFFDCRGIRLADAIFKDSPTWTMWLRRCEDIEVSRIRIEAEQKMINSDGIDFDACRNVRVGDSFFRTGDDCLVLRAIRRPCDAGREVVCENVVVSNCVLDSACQGVRVGCPSDDTIRNAVFRDIIFTGHNAISSVQPGHYLERGNHGRLRLRDIAFENWQIDCTGYPVILLVEKGITLREFGRFSFRNFRIRSGKPLRIEGNEKSPIVGVLLQNVSGTVAADTVLVKSFVEDFEAENYSLLAAIPPTCAVAAADIVLENGRCRFVLGADGRAKSLVVKATGEECLDAAARVPFFSVTQERPFNNENKLVNPNRRTVDEAAAVRRAGDLLVVNFRRARYAAEVAVDVRKDYFLFTLRGFRDLRKDYGGLHVEHPPAVEMRLADLPVRKRANFSEWLGVLWDDRAAVAVLGTSPDTFVGCAETAGGGQRLTADVRRGCRFVGGSAALVAAAGREPFLDCVDRFEAGLGLPRGVANRRNPLVNASIFWTPDICPTNVDRVVSYAKRGGFKMMLVYYSALVKEVKPWRRSGEWAFRDEYPNGFDDVRRMLDKIRAAGIVPGLHFLQTHIGLDTAYVTPHADHRLGLRRHFTLARPIGDGDDEIWVEESTVDVPEHPGMRILMFGGELLSYESATTEPPYRFRGIRRGALRTEVVPHRRGEIGGILDLSEFGTPGSCYLSQDSSLQDEIADKIAAFWRCGFRFVYMDGSEGVLPPCDRNIARSQLRVWKKLEPVPILGEAAAKSHFGWHMLSGANAFDCFWPPAFKREIIRHPFAAAPQMARDMTRVNFGWWGLYAPEPYAAKGQMPGSQPDMWEFGTSKAAAWDCPTTIQCNLGSLSAHPRVNDLLEVIRRWEDVRAKKWLTSERRALLKDPRRAFHLYLNEKGEYELHEIELLVPETASGLRAFLFSRNGRRVIAYWHTSGEGDFQLPLGSKGETVTLHAKDLRYLETELSVEEIRCAFGRQTK